MATKRQTKRKKPDDSAKLKRRCSALIDECRRLREEVLKLHEENRQLQRSVGALMCKDLPVNKRLKPSDAADEPPLSELIAELEAGRSS